MIIPGSSKMKRVKLFLFISILLGLIFQFLPVYSAASQFKKEELQITAKDGFNLVGDLYTPKGTNIKNKPRFIILLHAQEKDSRKWENFPDELCNAGFAVLNLDLRGHGRSIIDRRGKKRYWDYFSTNTYKRFPKDVMSSLDYIKDQYPEINTTRTGIIGAGLGAGNAIVVAYDKPRQVKALILINPFAINNDYGMDNRIPMAEYGNKPALFITSPQNKLAYKNTLEIYKYSQGDKQLKTYPFGMNTMDLVKLKPESKKFMVEWMKKHL